MAITKTNRLKPGMVLAVEVKNHVGRELIPVGTRLTEKHILNLKAWGITKADVEGPEEGGKLTSEAEKIDPAKLAKVQREAKALFCHTNQNHPAVAEFMRLFCLKRLKKMPGMDGIHVR
ncbi:MAG: hypothetical protein NPINA01_23640 [Nitrospinaceae bacterium]|nr:MAG: hypothetical protein NPINA01_23640 [Nitrospinaceae bacterium]